MLVLNSAMVLAIAALITASSSLIWAIRRRP